jgi:hypothetical protein
VDLFFIGYFYDSIEGRRCEDCQNDWGEIICIQVSAKDSLQATGVSSTTINIAIQTEK